jgi:Arc/MetJ-type ribon-helix-helix transcriptional regulator
MPRHRKNAKAQPRTKISITIPEDQIRWLDSKIGDRTFASLSHAVEVCILEAQKRDEKT